MIIEGLSAILGLISRKVRGEEVSLSPEFSSAYRSTCAKTARSLSLRLVAVHLANGVARDTNSGGSAGRSGRAHNGELGAATGPFDGDRRGLVDRSVEVFSYRPGAGRVRVRRDLPGGLASFPAQALADSSGRGWDTGFGYHSSSSPPGPRSIFPASSATREPS